ncbi:Bud-site selection protein [Paraphoma chrysanthemicola]|uniref:Bud-site selection protein n=1 Tax=Paraphoma chrysanthemicola TaxID=798071 RepID=A0A8K0QY67_9PLEO|nr:Bud-site selection protein [Paraphoma chrysanthemicola]
MVKRKRVEGSPSPAPPSSPDPVEAALKSQKRTCNRRILDAKKSLVAALRLGAGLERQKHSRRKKTAQAKGDTKAIARLDAEYAVLKSLELEKVADLHLRKTFGRVKSLKEHEALKAWVEGVEKGSTDPATLNVLARLYKVATVKKAVDDCVDDLKALVATGKDVTEKEGAINAPANRKKAKAEVKEDEDMLDVSDEEGDPYSAFSARIAAPSSGEDDSEGSISGDARPPSIGDSESDHDPNDDLVSESVEDDSFQGFSGSDEAASDNDRRIAPPSDLSESDSDEAAAPTAKARAKTRVEAKPTSSAFIPSLSHATYIAGSDSDASDLDAEFAPRKNRRGQRARQKIAEAKFGAKAKHIEKQERDKGWDPKRGAVSTTPRGYGPQQSGENTIPLGQKKVEMKRDDAGELHPSWQAAKLAKEKKQIKIDVRAPAGAGKKVVFD